MRIKPLFFTVWTVAFGCVVAARLPAQTFTTLYSFSSATPYPCPCINNDGLGPQAGLVSLSNALYGTAQAGGSSGYGTVFSINTDGTGFTNLYTFSGGGDGSYPWNGLVLSGSTLYGTTADAPGPGLATIFAMNTDGTGFTTLYSFTGGDDGAYLQGGLLLSGNSLYGAAQSGGSSGSGTLYAVNTDGTGFVILHSFSAASGGINSDGIEPSATLIESGETLYGTTSFGGLSGSGTVFAINTDGTGFRRLHSFTAANIFTGVNSDGANPSGPLLLSGRTLYGTTSSGGHSGMGAVFSINTNGAGFTILHSFAGTDGSGPDAGLTVSGDTLYGITGGGGGAGKGTVFALKTNGTAFTTLHSFSGTNSDGTGPAGGVLLSDNVLYGTTSGGGDWGSGTIFSISLPVAPPQLSLIFAGANLVLSWPTNSSGFSLQSTTNLGPSAIWGTNLPAPSVVNGQNMVTNPISGLQQFFRLNQ